jgi:hypothetical protein
MDAADFKQFVQRHFVTPLDQLPTTQLRFLDTNHDQSVRDFQDAIGMLFAPGGPTFGGKGATALAELVGKYLDSENAFSSYLYNSVSSHISQVISESANDNSQVKSLLASLDTGGGWGAMGIAAGWATQQEQTTGESSGPPGLENPIWDLIQIFIIVGMLTVIVWASGDQEIKIRDISDEINQWVHKMTGLAGEPESTLPADPSTLATSVQADLPGITIQNALSPDQQGLAQKLYADYASQGYTLDEILALIERYPELNEAQLRALLNGFSPLGIRAIIEKPIDWTRVADLRARYPHLTLQQAIAVATLMDEHTGAKGSLGLSEENAIRAVTSGPAGSTALVVGGHVEGADILFLDSSGKVVAQTEIETTQGTFSTFNTAVSRAAVQLEHNGKVLVQVPAGTDAASWLRRFRGSRSKPGELDKYKDVSIEMLDPSGNILYDGPIV